MALSGVAGGGNGQLQGSYYGQNLMVVPMHHPQQQQQEQQQQSPQLQRMLMMPQHPASSYSAPQQLQQLQVRCVEAQRMGIG